MPYINFKFEQQEDNDERYTRLLKEFDEKLERHLSDLLKKNCSNEFADVLKGYEEQTAALRQVVITTIDTSLTTEQRANLSKKTDEEFEQVASNLNQESVSKEFNDWLKIYKKETEALRSTVTKKSDYKSTLRESREFAIEILARACRHFENPNDKENMQQLVNLAEKLKKLETNGPDYTALWRLRLCAFIAIAALVAIAILFPPAVLLVVAASIVLVLLVGDSRRDWKIEERHELHKNELKAVKTVLMSHPFFEQKETGSVNETDSNENKFECPGNE